MWLVVVICVIVFVVNAETTEALLTYRVVTI
jgi:hypothetical protein